MSILSLYDTFVNLPPTGKQINLNGTVLANLRSPTDMFGAVELTFTGLKVGTDVVILRAGTNTVLESVDQIIGNTYTYRYFSSQAIDIGFIKQGFITLYLYNYPLSKGDVELPIQQRVDRSYV